MNVNFILELDFKCGYFFIKSIRLNEKGSLKYQFEYADRPLDCHLLLVSGGTVKKLCRKPQAFYVKLEKFENFLSS